MSYSLDRVQYLDELTEMYESIEPYIEKALTKAPELNTAKVLQDILSGYSHLWIARDDNREPTGIVTTSVKQYPECRVMLIHLLGGKDIDMWVHNISKIEDSARDYQCKSVEIQGRPAWKKLLPDYSVPRILLTKEL